MKEDWLNTCLTLSERKADFYSGCRKILRGRRITFRNIKGDVRLEDAGYTKAKMAYLTRAYLHQESIDVAKKLWDRRQGQKKYGSVGFTCYNHFIKTDPDKKSKRASVMGPCIQSVCLTLMENGKSSAVDVFYRTTELFKKFPADLVFLHDVLLQPFNLPSPTITFHFANITLHPMYYVTLIPHFDEPLMELDILRLKDKFFFDWVVKWTARYIIPEYHRGIAKFAQAQRVKMDAQRRIPTPTLKELQKYLIEHHPGHRNNYEDPGDDDSE